MRRRVVVGCALVILLAACGTLRLDAQVAGQPVGEPTDAVGLPNPASVYCEEQGHRLDIRTDADGSQYGVCVFATGGECEEWAYFRGECGPETEEATPAPASGVGEVSEEPETAVRPAGDLVTYANTDYGFAFDYPESWALDESPQTINLRRGDVLLHINYRRGAEGWIEGVLGTGMPSGDFVDAQPVSFLGQSITKRLLVSEGKTKVVTYGEPLGEPTGGLNFSFRLDDLGYTDYADAEVSEALQAEVEQVLASFHILD